LRDVEAQFIERRMRNSGEACSNMRYDPKYLNARPSVDADPPQYSEEELKRARFRREEGIVNDVSMKRAAVQRKLEVATARDKKIAWLKERGLL